MRHYSGVLVHVDPARFAPGLGALAAVAGVEVHQTDPPSGRCVAVLESADRPGQEALFERLRALPAVRSVELVYHLIDRGPAAPAEEELS